MRVFKSIEELIGHTPLLELCATEREFGLSARLLAKCECFNPAGSVKDRAAKYMIDDAEARGLLKKGSVIIEPTSGNTGIGLAAVAAVRGYKTVIVMPDTMSQERIKTMRAYGAEVVLTPGAYGMSGAIQKAEELHSSLEGSVIAGQFVNKANPLAHYETTGREIWDDTDGNVDVFVAGVGTGGTVSGVGRYLKEQNKNIRIVAVEPASSPMLSKGQKGAHKIQGIGAGFIPEALDTGVIDEVITVTDAEAYEFGRSLGKTEGLLAGISSGAAISAAVKIAQRNENKNIVVLLPDGGSKYLSVSGYYE